MKLPHKKIFGWMAVAVMSGGVIFAIWGAVQLREFKKVAEAAGGLPWQDAGRITFVQMACTRSCSGKCCCALCDASCEGSTQINFTGQLGTMFMCVPAGTIYKGGGVVPMIGTDVVAGGISNIMPLVVGIPGMAAGKMQQLANVFVNMFSWL